LVKVEGPGVVAEYVYGPLGRRLRKTVNGGVKEFRYDGEDLILEMDEKDSVVASYCFGGGIDNTLSITRNDTTLYCIKDGLGSVTALADSVGNVVQEYQYSMFGELVAKTGIGVLNPFLFTAREWEEEVELYFYRNRFYDAAVGRFLSEDPLRFAAGDLNLYRYVGNCPSVRTDPKGLLARRVWTKEECEEMKSFLEDQRHILSVFEAAEGTCKYPQFDPEKYKKIADPMHKGKCKSLKHPGKIAVCKAHEDAHTGLIGTMVVTTPMALVGDKCGMINFTISDEVKAYNAGIQKGQALYRKNCEDPCKN
jgi:RHS repeat-associated protein